MGFGEQCIREVVELHAFFEAWLRGTTPDTDEALDRFASVLDPAFHLVSPDGRVLDRAGTLAFVRGGHGREPDASIGIERPVHRLTAGEVAVVTYEEWQTRGARTRARLSTAVMRRCGGAPHGVAWLHVHECWK